MLQARERGLVVLKVRNAARSRDFYRRTLGLSVSFEDAELGAVFLSVGEAHHDLALFQLPPGELLDVTRQADATRPGRQHLAWRVESFEELQTAYRELKALGVLIVSATDHNRIRRLHFRDPDGNRVELYCDMMEN